MEQNLELDLLKLRKTEFCLFRCLKFAEALVLVIRGYLNMNETIFCGGMRKLVLL